MSDDSANRDLLNPQALMQLGNLQYIARHIVEGHLAGLHQSPYFGGSIEFAEHRDYTPGDETRMIDWRALARTDRYYIKQYQRETNLRATIILDASASMQFAMSTISKLQYATILAACLSRLLLMQGDQVSLATSTDQPRIVIPPRSGAAHHKVILDALENLQPSGDGLFASSVKTLARQIRKRGLVILLSDCLGPVESSTAALSELRSRGHEVILFHLLAPEEMYFRFNRWSRFENLESTGHAINADPITIRKNYLDNLNTFLKQLQYNCIERGCDYVRAVTDQPPAEILADYLRMKMETSKQ